MVNLALLCNKSPGSWINCEQSLRPPLYFVIFCFSFLLKHKVFQGRECLSLHLYSILQNGNLPVVLGPLGSADCNLCVWEGGGTHPASLEPAEPVQLMESHGEPLGLHAARGGDTGTRLSVLCVPYARVTPAEHLSKPSAVGQHRRWTLSIILAKRRFESSSLARELMSWRSLLREEAGSLS